MVSSPKSPGGLFRDRLAKDDALVGQRVADAVRGVTRADRQGALVELALDVRRGHHVARRCVDVLCEGRTWRLAAVARSRERADVLARRRDLAEHGAARLRA